ncbi:uncharacterized protein LOC117124252 isoform X2 [Anneissia japonica]|uniref:uncharacterized protein LOC117124252 isoform X2 n=1 Tax=Anneissia japonica TaxID=1529436 RepID=UPI0014257F19|nr:uncharacterized protein LOC117124252 isoform X2 [Anneissia japonica]
MSFGVIPLIWFATMVAVRPTDASFDYLSWNNMKIEENRALLGNIFQTLIEIRSRIECQSFCAQTNECKSYNYANSLKVCQLNNVTKEDTNAANFQETGDYIYATLKHDNVCTSKDCCLDPTTNKSKDKYCYIEIELEKEDASSSSVSVRVIVTAGRANQINTTCSEGDPSPTPDVVDFSENVVVSCDGVRSSRNVTVSVSVAYLDTISVTNSVTIKSKPDVVEFTSQTSSLVSISVEWEIRSGIASEFVVNCSSGVPVSSVVDAADGSGIMDCSGLTPGVQVEVTVVAVVNSKQSLPASEIVSTDGTVNITLIEDVATNTTTIVSKMTSNAPPTSVYKVLCSAGDPFPTEFKDAETTTVYCIGVDAGQSANLSVEAFYGNWSVGSVWISISTVPEKVVFEPISDYTIYKEMLGETPFAATTWNLTSGIADSFLITCSDGQPLEDDILQNVLRIGICSLPSNTTLKSINITVEAKRGDKIGRPAAITVSVIKNDVTTSTGKISEASDWTTEASNGSTASEVVPTGDPVNITLIEDVATNTTTIVAKMTSNAPPTSVYTVLCSAGDPFPTEFEAAETTTVYCIGIEAGQSANLSVEAFYGNWSVGSTWISISTVPEKVVFEPISDYTIYKEMLGETPFAATTWNLTSGIADSFLITCSDGQPLEDNILQNVLRIGICSLPSNTTLKSINITVEAKRGDKIGRPAAITVSVIKNDVTTSTGEISEASDWTTEASNGSTTSEVVPTDDPVNITLIEDVATNTTTIVAKMTSNAPPTSVYTVLCSAGDPFPKEFEGTETTTVYCIGVEAGQSANLSVEAFYGNWSVGSTFISISTVPEEVLFEPISDYTIYKEMLGETPFAATTWNLNSGIADSFLITCSDGQPLEDDILQNILRIGICSLPSNTTLQSINITVEAIRGDKIGRPATVTVSVIKNDVTTSTGEISDDEYSMSFG